MTDELRAALKRRRSGRYTTDDWHSDNRILADAYLAEHPADDEEPVDEVWLQALGFEETDLDGCGMCMSIVVFHDEFENIDTETLLSWNDDGSWGFWERPISERGKWHGVSSRFSLLKTRGQVRRLASVLGIELKEPT